ncbi:MAG TPA: hypothetical protein VN429_04035, partial [Methanospirillum sp.]|uniref:hypothetical protein n=1 Tax=Methanospirillum sp. TaxID=45200 RepID=UPI002C2815A3
MLQESSSKGHYYEGILIKFTTVSACDRAHVIDKNGTTSNDDTPDPGDGEKEQNTEQKYFGTSESFGRITEISASNPG